MTAIRRRLLGLLATLALLAIVTGLPATLLALGDNPIPGQLPSWDQVTSALLSPDDGTIALAAIKIIGWGAWLLLSAAIVAELAARVRGRTAPRLPGLRMPQLAARNLVSAAALLFIAAPLLVHHQLPAGAQPTATHGQIVPAAPTVAPRVASRPPPTAAASGSATVPYTVRRGDTLWSIAEQHLGSGARFPVVVDLNAAVLDGHPDFIEPGTVLRLPAPIDRHGKPRPAHRVIVARGDTLSGIAADELGDPDRYPEIFTASTAITQPGGRHLTDPDVIDIGWTLKIPGDTTKQHPRRHHVDHDRDTTTSKRPTTPRHDRPGRDGQPTDRPTSTPSPSSESTGPASPAPTGETSAPTADGNPVQNADGVSDGTAAPWLLTGLTGGGVVLAGSLWLVLRRRRRTQARHRRPGRTISVPAPVLIPVEQTVTAIGDTSAPTVERLDAVLRRLAASRAADRRPMPRLAAVELRLQTITLHLGEPDDLGEPWQGSDDRLRWEVASDVELDLIGPEVADQPAPYPLLVTIGSSDTGHPWLLNCEAAGAVHIGGDPTYSRDLARYVAAELACNPWSQGVLVDCVGVAGEIKAMNPDRIRSHPASSADAAAEVLADAVAMADRTEHAGLDAITARAHLAGADPWPARVLLIDAEYSGAALGQLLDVLNATPRRTATSVVIVGERDDSADRRGLMVRVTAEGRVSLPHAGLDLVAVGLTGDEALGCAALLAAADDIDDTAIPERADADGWQAFADEAGALRREHTQPRPKTPGSDRHREDSGEGSSILDGQNADYLAVAATTAEDLAVLAPTVPNTIRSAVEVADPSLDEDVTAWFSDGCDLPRLTLLGPVAVRTHGLPLSKRKPYYTELLTYLATRRHGATAEEVADAFSITGTRVRNDVKVVRDWLGVNPRTGRKHLPDARDTDAGQDRGIGVYQIEDLLIDADLFRRLRVRGETRGPHGMADLRRALSLVTGQPFDQLRPGGWTWLFLGDRLDQHLLCAVVDVAHLVTSHALHQGDLPVARAAAELAALAAPYEEIPKLDLAAVAAAHGDHDELDRIVRDEVCNRTDDDQPPLELPPRTAAILRAHDWPRPRRAAS